MAAARFAPIAGVPLNAFLTIHWGLAGIADDQAASATGRFLKLAGDWVGFHGGQFAWLWVRENGGGKGTHVHILLHIPPRLTLGHMQKRWLRSISGRAYVRNTIRTLPIGGSTRAPHSTPSAYGANLFAVVGYMLKGTLPPAAHELGLKRLEDGGRIVGKRAATSQNIGRAARSRRAKRV